MREIKLSRRIKYAGDVHKALIECGWNLEVATSFVNRIPDADAVEVVRCGNCVYWKPPYMIDEEGNEKPWDGNIRFCEESESGIYVAGKCKHRLNTAYHSSDMAYREEDDYCSYAKIFDERKNNGQIR